MLALGPAHVALAWLAALGAGASPTYVFTPLVDVVPGGAPLSAGEASELVAEAKNAVDARDVQRAYARLGSTLSLDDLLRGVEGLDDLSDGQRARIAAVLEDARAKHRQAWEVQDEILRLEARLDGEASAVLSALPEDVRGRVATTRPGPAGTARGAGAAPGAGQGPPR